MINPPVGRSALNKAKQSRHDGRLTTEVIRRVSSFAEKGKIIIIRAGMIDTLVRYSYF